MTRSSLFVYSLIVERQGIYTFPRSLLAQYLYSRLKKTGHRQSERTSLAQQKLCLTLICKLTLRCTLSELLGSTSGYILILGKRILLVDIFLTFAYQLSMRSAEHEWLQSVTKSSLYLREYFFFFYFYNTHTFHISLFNSSYF